MCEGDVHLIHAVFKALQVVAGHLIDRPGVDDPLARGFRIRRERRRVTFAEIGEDQTHVLARRIGWDPRLAVISGFLRRLIDALTGVVELPAVIDAADVIVFDPTEMHHGAAMRTTLGDNLCLAGVSAVERIVLAHDPDRLGAPGGQVGAVVERDPELTHELAARRPRPCARDIDVGRADVGGARGLGARFRQRHGNLPVRRGAEFDGSALLSPVYLRTCSIDKATARRGARVDIRLLSVERFGLALQLSFCLEVCALSDRLVSSAPE